MRLDLTCLKAIKIILVNYFLSVNESAEAVIRHNIFIHKNIAHVTADDIVELVAVDESLANQNGDNLMTSAAQEMMVCLYRNQLLNVFVRVALIAIPINTCVQDTLSVCKYAKFHPYPREI